jgi:hypothetical protein
LPQANGRLSHFFVGHPSNFIPLSLANLFDGCLALIAASIAFSIMHRNHVTAAWAAVFCLLTFKKRFYASCLDFFEVFYHTHVIADAVMFIEMTQPIAGHFGTLSARLHLAADFSRTIPFDESTVFPSDSATATMGNFAPLFWHAARICKVGFADATVHAAWRNQVFCELDLRH